MSCLSKKELIMLYYNELEEEKKFKFKEHLKHCNKCSKAYGDVKEFLSQVEVGPVEFAYDDIVNEAVKRITSKQKELSWWERCRYYLEHLRDSWRWQVSYQPRRVIIAVVIILLVLIYPWRRKSYITHKQFEILEIEMELSLQNLEGITLFDLLEEESIDKENHSTPPIPQNSSGVIHIKT